LPDHVTLLARFSGEPSPVKSTVTRADAEFRRTHADTWNVQKELFTEEQLEVVMSRNLNILCGLKILIISFVIANFLSVSTDFGRHIVFVIVFCLIKNTKMLLGESAENNS